MSTRQVFSNVELVPVGLDDKGGTTTIYLPGGDDGQASLKVHKEAGSWRDGATFESHACQTVRLDDFASDRSLTRLDFVKCDVEGAELLVMRGGAKTLARFQPILYLEVCPQWTVGFGYQPEDLCSFLRSLGYKTFMLVTEDCSRPFSANIEKLRALTKSANLLCLPPEK
jgi:FkbM family methyltransferase